MLRVYPERADYTTLKLRGLPLMVTSHRGRSAFSLSPFQGELDNAGPIISYTCDHEKISPYSYSVVLDEQNIRVRMGV